MIPVFGGVSFGHVVGLHDVDAAEAAERAIHEVVEPRARHLPESTIANVARSVSDMRMRVINDAIRDAVAEGAEALDAWVVFEGTTARVFTRVTTLDAPPPGPDGCQRFILNLRAAGSPGEAGGGEGAKGG